LTLGIEVLRRVRDVPQKDWDELAGDAPFARHTWLDCLEEAGCVGGRSGWTPMHLAVKSKDDLLAVAPMYLKTNSEGEFVYDWSFAELARRLRTHYYPKIVCAIPFTPAQGPRVLVRPGGDRAGLTRLVAMALPEIASQLDAHGAHVLFPFDDEAALWEGAGYMRRSGVQYHWHNKGYRDFADFLEGFTSKKRNQIKRERAQPGKDGIEIRRLAPSDFTPTIVDAMYRFYTSTVDKFVWGRRYLNRGFFDLVTQRMPDALAWIMAFDEGRPIAGAFNVSNTKTLWGRYWGATEERQFLHFNVCYYSGIEDCIARGVQTFEPGAGGEHKKSRGFDPTVTHSAHWIRSPRLREVLEPALERERDAIKEWVETGDEPE
jgi:hypothetical protein